MNQPYQFVSIGVAALLLLSPLSLYAEDIVGEDGAGMPPPQQNESAGKPPLSEKPQGGRMMPMRTMMGSTTGKNMPEGGMHDGKMMASGTRPLPPNFEKMIDRREGGPMGGSSSPRENERGRMIASSTPRDCAGVASGTKCLGPKPPRERMGEHRGDIFRHAGEMMLKRMHAAVERFEKLADRIDSRIAKMNAGGEDTSAAAAAMLDVRAKIADADKAVTDAETTIDSVANTLQEGTSTPSDNDKKPAKEALGKAQQALQAVQHALGAVIPLLGGGHPNMGGHASSTNASGTPKMPKMNPKMHHEASSTEGEPNAGQ